MISFHRHERKLENMTPSEIGIKGSQILVDNWDFNIKSVRCSQNIHSPLLIVREIEARSIFQHIYSIVEQNYTTTSGAFGVCSYKSVSSFKETSKLCSRSYMDLGGDEFESLDGASILEIVNLSLDELVLEVVLLEDDAGDDNRQAEPRKLDPIR